MSQGSQVDYDALAQQHGGAVQVDFDALAAQHGGTVHSQVRIPNFQPAQPQSRPGALQEILDVPKGAGKSLMQTLLTGSQYSNALDPILQKAGVKPEDMQGVKDSIAAHFQEQMKPQGTAQQLGAGLEQTGEMALTGGPLREGATALAAKIPAIGKYSAPGARVAAEAVNAAGNAELHGQDPNAAALVGAGGAGLTEMLPSISDFLQHAATRQYTKALAPTTGPNKVLAQRVVPGLIDRGVVGSPTGIAAKAGTNAAQAGQAVEAAENAIPKASVQDIKPVMFALDKIKSKYTVGGSVPSTRQGTADYIDALKNDIFQRSTNGQMPTTDLIQFRRMLDQPLAERGAFAGNQVLGNAKIDKAASNSMREILNSNNPDLEAANASFSFWQNVRKVAGDTAKRQTGQQGALTHVFAGAGLAGGLAHGGLSPVGGVEASAGVVGAYILSGVVRSPQWRTTSAVLKNRIADALATNNATQFFRAMSDFAASTASQSEVPLD